MQQHVSALLAALGMLPSALENLIDQGLWIRARRAVLPFAIVSNAVDLVVYPDGAALGDVVGGAPLDALFEHGDAPFAIIGADTLVQSAKVDTMLEGTVLHEVLRWNVGVLTRQTHGEAKVDLWVWVYVCGTELENIPETFGLAVHADNTVIFLVRAVGISVNCHYKDGTSPRSLASPSDKRQLEVDIVANVDHGG